MTYVLYLLASTTNTADLQSAFFSNDANKILAACVVVLAIVVVLFWRKIESLQAKIDELRDALLNEARQRAAIAEKSVAVIEAVDQKMEATRRR